MLEKKRMGRPSSRKALELAPVLGQINPVLSFEGIPPMTDPGMSLNITWGTRYPGAKWLELDLGGTWNGGKHAGVGHPGAKGPRQD